MARKHEAVRRLEAGMAPSAIAGSMGVSIPTVMNYLYNQVGEGRLQRSDIVFSIPREIRNEVDRVAAARQRKGRECDAAFLRSHLTRKNWDAARIADAEVYLSLRSGKVPLGDMYEWIYRIETELHSLVKAVLQANFGAKWWRKGIPVEIRARCAERKERDEDFEIALEPYCYTHFIDLRTIIDRNWSLFSKAVPGSVAKDKRRLLSGLNTLNGIRNRVMHPAKAKPPDEKTFTWVHDFLAYLELEKWKVGAEGMAGAAKA